MKHSWIYKNKHSECILFFSGWGFDEKLLQDFDGETYDLLFFYDYTKISEIMEDLSAYDKIHVIAWSLGVWVTNYVLKNFKYNISQAIAINGTLKAIDDEEGIPEQIYALTLKTWNDRNREKFNSRICGGFREYASLKKYFSDRSTTDLKLELDSLQKAIKDNELLTNIFTKSIIGDKDLIFSTQNQENFWEKQNTEISKIDSPHFPFVVFNCVSKILN